MYFIETYKKADNVCEKLKCIIAKVLHANVITPLGRIVLLPHDYNKKAKEFGITI